MKLYTLLLTLALAGTAFAKRPNILFIFTDDHGYQAISAYGSNRNKTPNIDRIASEGVRFENCFVTNSICGPSRAVILTGKHSHINGFMTNGDRFNGEQQTFPKLLQKNGYQTAIFGKWHLKSDPTGFDIWKVLLGQGPYYNPPMKSVEGTKKIEGYTTDIITDLSLEWLKEGRDKDKPFMLMCQHKAPHRNWQPGPDHLNLYDDIEMPYPETFWDDYKGRTIAASTQAMTVANHLSANDLKLNQPRNLTSAQLQTWNAAYEPKNKAFKEAKLEGKERIKWQYQRYVKDYLRCVASVDDNIGRILKYLDQSGLAENTVVIYSSDQGWYLGEHGWYDKRWMYEESFKTPLVARWPGKIKPGTVSNDLIMNIDFAPTLLDFAQLKSPEEMQGKSFKSSFSDTSATFRESVYYHYYEYPIWHKVQPHYGIRTERYKLIHFYYSMDEWELYDLENDPQEKNNIYKTASDSLVQFLKTKLSETQKEYLDNSSLEEMKLMTDTIITRVYNEPNKLKNK